MPHSDLKSKREKSFYCFHSNLCTDFSIDNIFELSKFSNLVFAYFSFSSFFLSIDRRLNRFYEGELHVAKEDQDKLSSAFCNMCEAKWLRNDMQRLLANMEALVLQHSFEWKQKYEGQLNINKNLLKAPLFFHKFRLDLSSPLLHPLSIPIQSISEQ